MKSQTIEILNEKTVRTGRLSFKCSLVTIASKQSIWKIWTDVESWPNWDTPLKSANLENGNEFKSGSVGQLVPRSGPSCKFKIQEVVPHERYTISTQLFFSRLRISRYFQTSDNEKLIFTHEVYFEGPLSLLFNWILGPGFRRVLPDVMKNIKVLAEKSDLEDAK